MTVEDQLKAVDEIYEGERPKVEPDYYEAAKIFENMTMNKEVLPYLLNELFTLQEIKFVNKLPATAEELAEEFHLDVEETRSTLDRLVHMGRIISTRKPPFTYAPHMNAIAFRDSIGVGMNAMKIDWMEHIKAVKLMVLWVKMEYNEYVAASVKHEMRVIPKYESIKDVPGVMFCENMKEIIDKAATDHELVTARCVCRSYASYLSEGKDNPDYCNVIEEHSGADGHCYSVSRQAEYFATQRGAYTPTYEEAQQRLKESDEAACIYTTPNTRDTTFVCSCCADCCGLSEYEKVGFEVRKPSRFRPSVNTDKCIGCKKCETRCAYAAIQVVDKKATVYEDKCMGCGNCVVTCPTKALKMKIVHDTDWVPDVPYVEGWYMPLTEEK